MMGHIWLAQQGVGCQPRLETGKGKSHGHGKGDGRIPAIAGD
jgi:hypothetical protein